MKHQLFKILIISSLLLAPTAMTSCSKSGCPAQLSFDPASRASYQSKKSPSKQLKQANKKKSGVLP